MIALIQLVTQANVLINQQVLAHINTGLVALVGIHKQDTRASAQKLLKKILHYRIFPDQQNKMNVSLKDMQGDLLLIPQFTLIAETHTGSRPGFSKGMSPGPGKVLFEYLVEYARKEYPRVETGQFGAHMQVNFCNDGPVSFVLQVQ